MIESLISAFSNSKIVSFLRVQNSSFVDYEEDLSDIVSDFEKFDNLIKIGEIEYDNTDKLMVFTCEYQGELTSRSSRKAQFEIAKKALDGEFKDGAVFVFYDLAGRFRFSFIRRNYGDKTLKYTPWKRYTYFVEPDATTNRTFIERIGTCKFDSLDNIQQAFSVEKLTKDFYKELSDWYFWAVKNVSFPNDISDDSDDEKYNSENIIRLITRLIFVWFLKQKGLIRNELFEPNALSEILKDFDAESETQNNYYRAILQNLFFATLNQEIDKRGFAEDKGFIVNRDNNAIKSLYRYEKEFKHSTAQVMKLFSQVPFLNGGLFECLDRKEKNGKIYDWDGFSRNPKYQARIPNVLFFAKENKVDLSGEYNDKKMKAVKVSGIIEILNRYNFTVEENTPVEVEVALDPELLGKVFENLLGAFNPETQETARKQTGSFYTPREIVNYMVNESLIAYFQTKVPDIPEDTLRLLFSYDDKVAKIDDTQRESLIQATFDCIIIDPACGSGAFPMGALQQLVHILKKLDPDNTYWNSIVMNQAMKDFDKADRLSDEDIDDLRKEIEKTFDNSLNYPDYARKLHVIENCIYGVDIQSIAVQISKLRFFISLVCEQHKNTNASENFGIRPLPNLETKFVAANTLIGLEKTEEDLELFNDDHIKKLIDKLQHLRHRQFLVTNATEKKRLREKDQKLREEIENEVTKLYVKHADDQLGKYKLELKLTEKELTLLNKMPDDIRTNVSTDLFGITQLSSYNFTEAKRKNLKVRIKSLTDKINRGNDYSRLNSIVFLARQLTSWNPYDQNQSSPFFDPEWMFGLPKQNEGYFDVVIGNPPYGAKLSAEEKKLYRIKYPESQFKIDTYSLFILHSLKIQKMDGISSFIIPNTLLDNFYEENVRRKLLSNRIHELCDLNDKIFESAVVHAMIISYIKEVSSIDYKIRVNISNDLYSPHSHIQKSFFEKQENCIFQLRNQNNDLLEKLWINSERLENILDIRQAIKSGDDKKYISDTKLNDQYKPILRGKDVFRYQIAFSNKYLHYGKHLACPRSKEIFEQPKILIREAGATITATFDDSNFYIMSSLYNAISKNTGFDLKYLLGLINSKLFQYLMNQSTFEKTKGAFTKAKIYHWYNLPVKITRKQMLIAEIVNKILDMNGQFKLKKTVLEQQIDNLVYRLYDLTYEEVKMIDSDIESKISEADYNAIII